MGNTLHDGASGVKVHLKVCIELLVHVQSTAQGTVVDKAVGTPLPALPTCHVSVQPKHIQQRHVVPVDAHEPSSRRVRLVSLAPVDEMKLCIGYRLEGRCSKL